MLKQTLLQLAVMGKLVPQDPGDEPASVLLKSIKDEKLRANSKAKIKKYVKIHHDEIPFKLPTGWEWRRLGELCDLQNGDSGKNYPNKSALVESGVPFVNAGHLQNGQIDKIGMTLITRDRFDILKGGKFQENDILFCLRGSLGKYALVKGFKEGAIASSLVIIRLNHNMNSEYFYNYFNSSLSLKMVKKYDNGTAQPNLSSADLSKFLVPLPPKSEQQIIVNKVNEIMLLCDDLNMRIKESNCLQRKLSDIISIIDE